MTQRKYWSEEIETMVPAALGRLEVGLLVEQMANLHHASLYFRAKFDDAGIGPGDIRDQRDLARLPFT
jgi:phenylacetate-coenzyme A ligase PaaK-like adenylate-forming protein